MEIYREILISIYTSWRIARHQNRNLDTGINEALYWLNLFVSNSSQNDIVRIPLQNPPFEFGCWLMTKRRKTKESQNIYEWTKKNKNNIELSSDNKGFTSNREFGSFLGSPLFHVIDIRVLLLKVGHCHEDECDFDDHVYENELLCCRGIVCLFGVSMLNISTVVLISIDKW